MSYSSHAPNEFEAHVIETAYRAQQRMRLAVTRFTLPQEAHFTPSAAEVIDTPQPFGVIVLEGVEIRGKDAPSDIDGLWDKITYDGEEWLVRKGVVLKKNAEPKEPS